MSKTLDRLGLATVTLATGYTAGAFAAAAMGEDWQTGGQVGAAITMAGVTYISLVDQRPHKPRLNHIIASDGDPVRVNGKTMFLNLVPWINHQNPSPPPRNLTVFYVPYRSQRNPVRVLPGQLEAYALQGWKRQQAGDDSPFARHKFTNFRPQLESCCYKILGYSGCFDTFGQGAKSKLIIPPHRIKAACMRRFSPTLAYQLSVSGQGYIL